MNIEDVLALPHQQKCIAIYDHLCGLAKQIETVYQQIGRDDDLFPFQAAGVDALNALEAKFIDIRNDLNKKLTCKTTVEECDCSTQHVDHECEDETVYSYFDENGNRVEWEYLIGR